MDLCVCSTLAISVLQIVLQWCRNEREKHARKLEHLFMVLWHGRSCQEMCGTILWVGKQDGSTTPQSIYSMHWRPSFQRVKLKSVGELSRVCSQIVLKCWNLARIRRPDILWSKNKFARSITKNRPEPVTNDYVVWYLIFITHVNIFSVAMWEILPNNVDWWLFQDSDFARDLDD